MQFVANRYQRRRQVRPKQKTGTISLDSRQFLFCKQYVCSIGKMCRTTRVVAGELVIAFLRCWVSALDDAERLILYFPLQWRTNENFTKSACEFLAEVIVYESLQRFLAHVLKFFFFFLSVSLSLLPRGFKAESNSDNFTSRSKPSGHTAAGERRLVGCLL